MATTRLKVNYQEAGVTREEAVQRINLLHDELRAEGWELQFYCDGCGEPIDELPEDGVCPWERCESSEFTGIAQVPEEEDA